jgi:ketosteroid isomerase-like protein
MWGHARGLAILRAMSRENVDKVQAFITAYNARELDAAMESFDAEIDWVLPARQRSDSCRGLDEIRQFWRGLDETFEELWLEPQEHVDSGDRIATRLRFHGRGKGSGLEIETEMYHQVATFQDGRIVRIEYFAEWDEALEAARN